MSRVNVQTIVPFGYDVEPVVVFTIAVTFGALASFGESNGAGRLTTGRDGSGAA